MIKLPSPVRTALEMLENAGFEAYIVGGCVRDSLLGAQPEDYDITTSALPEEVAQVFADRRVIGTGLKHGTQTVIIDKMPLEITTFRVEGAYSDSRHPDSVSFTRSLREDVERRDFTMNAIAGAKDGSIVDFCGGEQDIKNGIIRCVGEPEKRFGEDALRVMRALRFSSVLGFEIEQETAAAAHRCREKLRNVSAERIYAELVKLLCGRNVRQIIMEYIDILGVVLPELLPMKGFDQRNPHHVYDILEHTAIAVENAPAEPILRLAALLHDTGKPEHFTLDAKGVGHFHGHPDRSAQIADEVLRRLKTDTATRRTVTELVRWHDAPIGTDAKTIKRWLNRLTPELFFMLLELKRADSKAKSPEFFWRLEEYAETEAIARRIIEEHQCFSLKELAVNGSDLMDAGLARGRQVGEMLERLLDAVINDRAENEKAALLEYAKQMTED